MSKNTTMEIELLGWTRLEPGPWGEHLELGLEARLHDPLWLLARQWQLGEFTGVDGGSPVRAELEVRQAELDRFHPADGRDRPYDVREAPLEVLVEREPEAVDLSVALESGRYFLELLQDAGLGNTLCAAVIERYPITVPPNATARERAYIRVATPRIPDGAAIFEQLSQPEPALLPLTILLTREQARRIAEVCDHWRAWWRATWPGLIEETENPCWRNEDLDHRFAVTAPAGSTSRQRLSVDAYDRSRLDWYSFNRTVEAAEEGGKACPTERWRVIPSSLEVSGMPAAGWWDFEDGAVHLDAVLTAAEDSHALLLLDFIFHLSETWHLAPLPLAVGSLYRIVDFTVADTFGKTHQLLDENLERPPMRFSLFRLHDSAGHPDAQLFLPPILASRIRGDVRERVMLARDELANMAWAIEKTVAGTLDTPTDRQPSAKASRSAPTAATTPEAEEAELTYRLVDALPSSWFPLMPVPRSQSSAAIDLELAPQPGQEPAGRILASPSRTFRLNEDVLPRNGLELSLLPQSSRWLAGATFSWLSRRKRWGMGEIYRGVDFDHTDG